tara:strand:- start:2009 stop:4390 length:2382 start_codon:yes stop_codon:yes gene_type:complete
MAYKFQVGDARLGGNLIQEGTVSGSSTVGALAGTFTSVNLQSGGITNAGAIAGATTVNASSTITGGSLTDGTATITGGAASGLTTVAASGNITTTAGMISGSLALKGLALTIGDSTVIDKTKNVKNVATVSGSSTFSAKNLVIDTNQTIGTAGDNDLLTLRNNELRVAGDISGSLMLAGKSLQLDNGQNIGIAADTDLMKLTANTVTVNGVVSATGNVSSTGGSVSGSAGLSGKNLVIDDGQEIGIASDLDLMTLSANTVTVAGAMNASSVSGSGQLAGKELLLDAGQSIGIAGDTDLMTLTTNTVTVAGAVAASGNISTTGGVVSGSMALKGLALTIGNATVLSKTKAVQNVTTVSGSGNLSGKDLVLDNNRFVGIAGDTDLMKLSTNAVKVAGEISGSMQLKGSGIVVDTGGEIGTAGDPDLMTLTTNTVTVAGAMNASSVSGSGQLAGKNLLLDAGQNIGIAGDTDLLTLKTNVVTVAGAISGSGALSATGAITGAGGLALQSSGITAAGAIGGVSALTAITDLDIGAHDFRAATLTADGLTSGRVLYATTNGQLTDDSNFTYDGSTLTLAGGDKITLSGGSEGTTQLDVSGDVRVTGNLIVSGSKVVHSTSHLLVNDPIIGLGYSEHATGSAGDRGLMMGLSGENAAVMFWDENETEFAFARTTSLPTDSAVTVASYADLQVKDLTVNSIAGSVLQTITAIGDEAETLAAGFNYGSATLTAARAWTLPASPTIGQIVYVKAPSNCGDTNTITITRAGSQTIDGATTAVLQSPFAAVGLCYVAADLWKLF